MAAALLLLWAVGRWAPMAVPFPAARSTVLLDRHGQLLNAVVADDGQWRFPAAAHLPPRYARSCLTFEDRRFHLHPGLDPIATLRALGQNIKAGRTVSGGSTITMQVARMALGNRDRTVAAKLRELLYALRLELRYSKQEILAMHAANAPFGGNVVGLEAAAWRWFGMPADQLGWSQCATLAVLPNAPATIYPGRGHEALRAKRDRLLHRLYRQGDIDSTEWSIATTEALPDAPLPLPRDAPHLLTTLRSTGHGGTTVPSTLDAALQRAATATLARYAPRLRANEVHNAAALVLDMPSGQVLVYVGNLPGASADQARDVDIVQAPRSTGSLLKPFLFADMLQHGELLPTMLVADVPTRYEGFRPRNFDETYQGALPAKEALARSLNVPAVRALREHGIERTLRTLRGMGLHSIGGTAEHYGLALVLGGAESSLWELAGAYASMARIPYRYGMGGHPYHQGSIHPPVVLLADTLPTLPQEAARKLPLSASAIHHTLAALTDVGRPAEEQGWQHFAGAQRIAWKTGTSFGHRDAWAIGVNGRHVVAVWTGNASGEGRPGLTGTLAAAPLLFDLFTLLPKATPLPVPADEMRPLVICRQSGHRAGTSCNAVDTLYMPIHGDRSPSCPYHRTVVLDPTGKWRITSGEGTPVPWFVLPPAMERYYRQRVPQYRPLPPFPPGTPPDEDVMEVVSPLRGTRLLLPRQLDGSPGKAVVEAAHRDPNSTVHWDLDGQYLGATIGDHSMALAPPPGEHVLTLTDAAGNTVRHPFTVITAARTDTRHAP